MESNYKPAIETQHEPDRAANESSRHGAQPVAYVATPSRSPDNVGNQKEFTENLTPATSISTIAGLPGPINTDVAYDRTSSISLSYSASSDRQPGHRPSISDATDPADRVFPIRSTISVDSSQPAPATPSTPIRNPGDHNYLTRQGTTWDGRRRQSNSHASIEIHGDPQRVRNGSITLTSPPAGSPNERNAGRTLNRKGDISNSMRSPPPKSERAASEGPLLFSYASSDNSDRTRESTSTRAGESHFADSSGPKSPGELNDTNDNLVTVRFRHVVTEEGHAVITGRDGALERCEDEPIHAPGAIQPFGLLVAFTEETDGRLIVRCVSENSKRIIGFSPQELFQLESFTEIFTEEQADNLLDHVDFIRDEEADPATNGPDVFSISVRPPQRRTVKLWCAIHVNNSHPDLIICEFELEEDAEHPLRPPGELTPDEPEDTLYQNPSMEELHESTEITSRPLRILRSARQRRGEAGAMQVFDIMSQVQEQLASAPNLDRFLKILVGIVKELTGFHRVMIYQFDAAFNGKVVTELVDPAKTRDLYYGLHFPASDIPKQARDLYKVNKVRLLYDRDLESARLVCRSAKDLERPLDLSHSYLRAMSPIHLKYLGNMAVRSSMSISINAFNELWGLIACHSYGSKGMRVPFPIRKLCRLVGDTASRNIERLSYASRLQARKLINTMPTDKNPSGYITASSSDLIKLFDADFGMLSIRGETKILGKIEQTQEPLAMLEYLRLRSFTSVLTSQDIREDFPDLRYPPGFSVVAGLLYVPLSVGGNDFIVFFRKGQVREVRWAGNPYEKVVKEGTSSFLEPRSSFKAWHEIVIGKCREWNEEQVETAAVLCLVYGKFIEVWRQKEAALQSSRLTRLLLANSAHEVRTPLNAIINCLEIAMEGPLDHETRENLARSHSASKSLIYVINDLLDLTNMEEGQNLIKDEVLDLLGCIHEATEPFKVDAKRKSLSYEVIDHPGLPRYVHGDFRRVRQAVANVTANAIKHTSKGSVVVESYVTEVLETRVKVEIVVQDTGNGMSNEKLDNLFRDLEQVSADVDDSTPVENIEKPGEGRTLGLGLAVVARIVRNMNGQLRLKSEEGKGSRFVIQLPFDLPTEESLDKLGAKRASVNPKVISSTASITKAMPSMDMDEVMLIDKGSTNPVNAQRRGSTERRSFDETKSISSARSAASNSGQSNKSDADRLIDAIQTPLTIGGLDEKTGSIKHISPKERQDSHHTMVNPPTTERNSLERPSTLQRSNSAMSDGSYPITDTKTSLKPVKVPDEFFDRPLRSTASQAPKIPYEIAGVTKPDGGQTNAHMLAPPPPHLNNLKVLVAEDDPINMKILQKRLEKAGHEVYHAVNGEDCAAVYRERPGAFDVILMDMQMPIVDGLSSTKMIRAFEKAEKCLELSTLAAAHKRTPIFAVSASLLERDSPTYMAAGFDGWILKPVDFKRLNIILDGISKEDIRTGCFYVPGQWEKGGWFERESTSEGGVA
ncbi:hsp90-like protein [Annulohypoxylon maeteangense]|uniref:hsp90-like protein n=1 Tax=Annulohypoxylon maeteangense TaxID=1927788 RepID=UPI0020078716|nr:hsp90-like protein [Annulohypoxylon maeteangense]KAI0888446.1 hsp90-like protein [Annulohypoxylon maeteangense]